MNRYDAFMSSSPNAHILINKNGSIVYANPKAFKIFKYDEEVFYKLNIDALINLEATNTSSMAVAKGNIQFPVAVSSLQYFDDESQTDLIAITITDLSTLHKTEELLLETNRIAKVGGWEYDIQTQKIYWTQVTREIHETSDEYTPEIISAIDFYHGEAAKATITQVLQNAIQTGEPFDVTLEIYTAKGNIKQVKAIGKADYYEGKVTRVYGTFQDISVWVEAQKKMAYLASNFNQIMNTSIDIISVVNEAGEFVMLSKSAEEIWGYKIEDAIGKRALDFIIEEDWIKVQGIIEQLKSGIKVANFENRSRAKDGKIITISWSACLDPTTKLRYAIGRDISAKVASEAQMKLLQSVITNSTDAVIITEAEPFELPGPKIIYVNNAFTKMTGYSAEEVLGKTPRILQGPESNKDELDRLKKSLANWEPCEIEIINYKKNGDPFWVNFSVVPVAREDGYYTHWIAIERDITQKKKEEAEKTKLINELVQNNKDLKQFSYITSHNLRAPVTNLMALIKLLDWSDIHEDQNRILLESFEKSTNQLNDTINDLLKILIVKEQSEITTTTVSLTEVLNTSLLAFTSLFKELDVSLKIDFKEARTINFNKEYLESIFINLISNALKYNLKGRKPIIEITSKNIPGFVQMSIKDNGIGIDLAKNKDKIFKLFQTFHSGRDSKGIGLYLIQSQLNALGGRVEVESEVDKGTVFTIFFKK
ncbi:MAG: PAS domain S-box protein [Sphingobacteriia bacterium]|nr:MAG: PAS domain S-box protein [Sphingobacteriia bacterium]